MRSLNHYAPKNEVYKSLRIIFKKLKIKMFREDGGLMIRRDKGRHYIKIKDCEVFGANIAYLRDVENMKLYEWADYLEYDRNRLSELEQGWQDIKLSTAVKIAKKLNKSVAMLFDNSFRDDPKACQSKTYEEADYLQVFSENASRAINLNGRNKSQLFSDKREVSARVISRTVHDPRIKTLGWIASALGTTLSELLLTDKEKKE